MNGDDILIDQALHGYRQGHGLIASSVELPSNDKRKMLYLSDASGPDFTENFDGYLEGYPLSSGVYVLSRTWKAPEMPRPGCVWTHSLIINRVDLGSLCSLSDLFIHFRRPNSPEQALDYKNKVTAHVHAVQLNSLTDELGSLALATSFALDPEKQFIVSCHDRLESEASIQDLWHLLNEAQRFSLSFCCGYLSSSQATKDSFQLTFIPKSGKRFSWDKNTAIHLDIGASTPIRDDEADGLNEIIAFVFRNKGISKYSFDLACHLHLYAHKSDSAALMKLLQASELSSASAKKVFGAKKDRFKSAKHISEAALLELLVTNKDMRDLEGIDLILRFKTLEAQEQFAVFRALLARDGNGNGEDRILAVSLHQRLSSPRDLPIDTLPDWLVVDIIVNNRLNSLPALTSLSEHNFMAIVSQVWSEAPSAAIDFLVEMRAFPRFMRTCVWVLQRVDDLLFTELLEKLHADISQLPYQEFKSLLDTSPSTVIGSADFEATPESFIEAAMHKAVEINDPDLFFKKLNALNSLSELRWSDELWLNLIALSASIKSHDANMIFVKLYPYARAILGRDLTRNQRLRLRAMLPLGRLFKRLDTTEGLLLTLIEFLGTQRISVRDFLLCLDSKDDLLELACAIRSLRKHERLNILSLLESFSGTKQEESKVNFLLDAFS